MKKDPNIWALTGDLGYIGFDKIREDFPDRFLNCGAAEQAMLDIACGLALEGKKPFCYSITPFLIYRPFETIRTYINHEKIPVRLVGSGRDKDYAHDGFSHDATDINFILSCFENIEKYFPDTTKDMEKMVELMILKDEPAFISLTKKV
jgi:transketolase